MFQLFIDAFAQAFPDSLNILLLDNSGAHTAQRLRWPENVRGVWLPPYCPELNPIERLWRDVNDDPAWQSFPDLDTQQDHVSQLLQAYEAYTLQCSPAIATWLRPSMHWLHSKVILPHRLGAPLCQQPSGQPRMGIRYPYPGPQ
jgi:hypothetical protein